MHITHLIKKDSIELNVISDSKQEIIKKAIDLMEKNGNIPK